MDLMGIFRKDLIVGLDISSSAIKVSQFVKKDDGLHLLRIDLKEFQQAGGDAGVNEQEMIGALKVLLRGIDIHKAKIIVSINCAQTVLRKVTAPYMPKAELCEGVKLESKNYFPFSIDQFIFDFEILGEIIENGIKKYELIVAVSPEQTVNKYLSLLEKAGVKSSCFVPFSYALQKLAECLYFKEGETQCFVDIGEFDTELIVCKGKDFVFNRKIPVKEYDFTKVLTSTLSPERSDEISSMQILSMARIPLERLAVEIEKSFDYYKEEGVGRKIDSVIVSGEGALLGDIIKYLAQRLGVEVRLGDPLTGLKDAQEAIGQRGKDAHRFSLSIGAALSEGKGLNLLPVVMKEEAGRMLKRITIESIAITAALIFILTYIGMKIQLANFEKGISVAKLELSSLQPQLKQVEAQNFASAILVEEPRWEDVFIELSNLIPDKAYITHLKMNDNLITMEGAVVAQDGEQILAHFILALEKGLFSNVKLVESKNKGDNGGIEFELKCKID
ncbi:MAG: pilus assembly protein PilM [Candidatus Omnitrophota bacterium]